MNFEILNKNSLLAAKPINHPFKFFKVNDVIHKSVKMKLLNTFPDSGFVALIKNYNEKEYKINFKELLKRGGSDVADYNLYNNVWKKFIEELKSNEYRKLIEKITGLDLEDTLIEINLWSYTNSCYLSPHTDKIKKKVTHLFYFCSRWKYEWGGNLCIHDNKKSITHKILPIIDNSIILITSNVSWHSVEGVNNDMKRNSLQVVFWSK